MEADKYVFLSYARQDSALAEKVTRALNERGIHVWRDVEQLLPGVQWELEITKSLERSAALLYLATKAAAKSHWMLREVEHVYAKNKLVIPILATDSDAKNLPVFLSAFQAVRLEAGFEAGIESIAQALRGTVTPAKRIEPETEKSKGYVFLSYAEEDIDFVEKLRLFLMEHKYGYWDYSESDRNYHAQLFLELEGVIAQSEATLSILTESWKRSSWTVREYFYSEEIKKPVFLLKAKEMSPTLAVAGLPYIDFVSDSGAGFLKLHRELKRKGL